MKYKISISGVPLILNETQMALLLTAVQDAEQLAEKHVGTNKGSQGYSNSYIPTVEVKQPHEWLQVHIVADDFVEATKLAMKLDTGES
jgi:hypothetical protein